MSDRKLGYAIIFSFLVVFCVASVYFIRPLFSPLQKRVIAFEKTGNLRIDDQVRVKGMQFGSVQKIEWTRQKVLVVVRGAYPLTFHTGCSVVTMDAGIMGDRMIMIDNGPENAPVIPSADTLVGTFIPGVSEAVGYAWKLHDAVDSLMDLSALLLRGNSRHLSIISQTKSIVKSVDSLSKSMLKITKTAQASVSSGIDSLNNFVNKTSSLSRTALAAVPSYRGAIERQLAKFNSIASIVDSATAALLATSTVLSKEDNVLWRDDIRKLTTDLITVQKTVSGIQNELLKFKTYLRLW